MQKVATHSINQVVARQNHQTTGINDRVNIIQKGAKNFLSKIKTVLSADSKWTLEIVCLNEPPIPAAKTDSVSLQAKKYLQYQLWQKAQQINRDRVDWVKMMKG